MLDAGQVTGMQRTRGRARVAFAAGSRLRDLAQAGSAKAMLPKVHSDRPEVVFLNTAGGLTGGDQLEFSVTVEDGAEVVATTQTAERAYASNEGAAQMRVRLDVQGAGTLDWLPQETILFNHAALERETEVTLGADARFLMCETLVLGRAAMGENIHDLHLRDRRRILRAGQPVITEPYEINSEFLAQDRAAGLDGARAISTVALVAQGAEDALSAVRAGLPDDVRAAASAWNGRLIVRLMAADGWPLRRALVAVLGILRAGPLPRVWQI